MLKGLVAFGLTRRPIALLLLAAFIVAGAVAFTKLNIEAYPNPAPVIIEITAQSAGLSAEEMERLYTVPIEVGVAATPGRQQYPLDLVLRAVFRPRHLRLWRGLLFRAPADRPQPSAERQPSEQRPAANPGLERGRRDLPLSGQGARAFRPDQSQDHPGLDFAAPPADRARRGAGQHLGRHNERIRGRGGPRQARSLWHHAAAARHGNRQCEREHRRAQHQYRQAVGQYSWNRFDRQRRRRRPDAGPQGRRYRGHNAFADKRRTRTDQGCRAGFCWHRSASWQGWPG